MTRLLNRWRLLVVALIVLAAIIPATTHAQGQSAPPNGFSFDGTWDCNGAIGKNTPHHSTYEGSTVLGGRWTELTEVDIQPSGYVGRYLVGYDSAKRAVREFDANNFGYGIYNSDGWHGSSLTLVSTDVASNPTPNRFVYTVGGPSEFTVEWQLSNKGDWKTGDRLVCRRGAAHSGPLVPHLVLGDTLFNIFSRAISFKVDGYLEYVRRVSGTASYIVRDTAADHLTFDSQHRYDGRAEERELMVIRDGGGSYCDSAGKCEPRTDGSGLLYNASLWGDAPGVLRDGMTWTHRIATPWELGPPGTERVSVLHVDAAANTVTLERDGTGDGSFDGDLTQITLLSADSARHPVSVTPGPSHWVGYTTFRNGVVMSDELLVERPVVVTSASGDRVSGIERQYILLNAMPAMPHTSH